MKLPGGIYKELLAIKGPTFIFEAFPEQLRRAYLDRGWDRWAGMVADDYRPIRLKRMLEREKRVFLKTKAKEAGVSYEDAAIAFGRDPETMRKYYVALDELVVSDRVMVAIHDSADHRDEETEISPCPPSGDNSHPDQTACDNPPPPEEKERQSPICGEIVVATTRNAAVTLCYGGVSFSWGTRIRR